MAWGIRCACRGIVEGIHKLVEEPVDKAVEAVMRMRAKAGGLHWLAAKLPARWRRSLGSLRTQLIVWNIVALSLLLGGLGVVCRYAIWKFLLQSVDQNLESSISLFIHPPPKHGPPHGSPGGKSGSRPEPGPERGQGNRGEHGPGPNDREEHSPGPASEEPGMGRHSDGPPSEGFQHGKHGPGPPGENSEFRVHHYNAKGQTDTASDTRPIWDKAGLAAALQNKTLWNTVTVNEEPVRVISAPGFNIRGEKGAVQSARPLTEVYWALKGIDTVLLLLIPVGLLGAGWMGSALTNRVLRRVQWMTQAAGRIGMERGSGGFARRLPVVGSDEFAELANTFNGMLGRLDKAFQEQAQSLELQQRFTADASHELKTPLTIIKGRAGLALGRETTDERSRRAFQEISKSADSMSNLVQDLLLLARADEGQMGRDRRELLMVEILQSAREQALQDNCAPIDMDVEPQTLTVTGNQAELARLFRNLLDNAVRYTPPDGNVSVAARCEQGFAVVTVRDNGSGIALEHLGNLGKRFYRVDESRTRPTGGTGLGLSICRGIVEAHGGTIAFESELGVGTTVVVRLPTP